MSQPTILRNRSSFMISLVEQDKAKSQKAGNKFRKRVSEHLDVRKWVAKVRAGQVVPWKPNQEENVQVFPKQSFQGPDQRATEDEKNRKKVTRCLILPDSTFRTRWDILILLFVIYYGILIPMRVAFYSEESATPQASDRIINSIDVCANVIFTIDMFLNFRTAYREKGEMVTDDKLVAWNYLKFWFWIDLISILPFDEILGSGSSGSFNYNILLRLLKIFKLFRVFRVMRILKRFEEVTKVNPSVLRLMKMCILLLFIWHIIACCYWFIAEIETFGFSHFDHLNGTLHVSVDGFNRDGGNLWVPPPEIWCEKVGHVLCNETAFEEFDRVNGYNPFRGMDYCFEQGFCPAGMGLQYTNAFFWAVMVTTGIGRDIMPVTILEHVYSSAMIFLGVFMYAIIIGSLSSSISNLDVEKAERKKQLDSIKQFLRQRKVPISLQRRIVQYYEYLWSSQMSVATREGMLGDLHQTLWLELHISLNRKLLDKVKLFENIKDPACVVDIIEKLTPKIFIPGEYVFLQGEISSEMFIIVRGSVEVLMRTTSKGEVKTTKIHSLNEGEVFGESSLLNRARRNASIRAETYCDMVVLAKTDFDQVMRKYPEFRVSMYQLAAQQARGWHKLRCVLKAVRSITLFGGKVDLRQSLLGEPATGDNSINVTSMLGR